MATRSANAYRVAFAIRHDSHIHRRIIPASGASPPQRTRTHASTNVELCAISCAGVSYMA